MNIKIEYRGYECSLTFVSGGGYRVVAYRRGYEYAFYARDYSEMRRKIRALKHVPVKPGYAKTFKV